MFVEYIEFFFSRSIGVLVELVRWRTQNFTIIDQEKHELTNFLLEPQDYRVYYVNIDLRHQYGISVAEAQASLLAKRPWLLTAMNKERRLISQAKELIPISFPEFNCKNIRCQIRFLFDIYLFS